jgi:hypothetical protein
MNICRVNLLDCHQQIHGLWSFWCGAWDADAQSGYMVGYLGIPLSSSLEKIDRENGIVNNASTYFKNLSEMMDNPSKIRQ